MAMLRRTWHRPRWLLVAVMVGAGILAGAGTLALADPSSGATYYACVNNNSGTIKMVAAATNCANGESKIQWNEAGQPGPIGPAGPAGVQGPAGPAGSSRPTYINRTGALPYGSGQLPDPDWQSPLKFTTPRIVAALTGLPSGTYAVTAVENATGGAIHCKLLPGGALGGQDGTAMASLTLTDIVTLDAPGDITLTCDGAYGEASSSALIRAEAAPQPTVAQLPTISGPANFTLSATGVEGEACLFDILGSGLMPGSTFHIILGDGLGTILNIAAGLDGTATIPFRASPGGAFTVYGLDTQNNLVETPLTAPDPCVN